MPQYLHNVCLDGFAMFVGVAVTVTVTILVTTTAENEVWTCGWE